MLEERRRVRDSEHLFTERSEFVLDLRHLLQTHLVQFGSSALRCGVRIDEGLIPLETIGDMAHADVVLVTGSRQDLVPKRVAVRDERGTHLRRDDGLHLRLPRLGPIPSGRSRQLEDVR